MKRVGRFCAAVAAGAACLQAPAALAQGKIDQKLLMRYGGVLAPQCGNYLLPQLIYLGESLVVRDGGKPILTGRNVKAAPQYFSAKPPPEFETALTSDVGGEQMVFVFYRNASGLYASVEGGPKVMAALPAVFKGKRVRHCDPNRNAVPGAPPPAAEPGPPELLRDANFRQPYLRALGPLAKDDWLLHLDGPAPEVKKVNVAGQEYRLVNVCKNHDCYDNNLTLLYAAASRTVYAKVFQRGRSTFVGGPPPAVAAELERIWKVQWRSAK